MTSRQIVLHHTTFHITPIHTTPFHIPPPLHNIPYRITTYHMFHVECHNIPPQTSHYTAVCLPPPFHTITSQSTTYSTSHSHSPHLAPFRITPTFNNIAHLTPYSTSHYTTTSLFYITPPQLTSQQVASFFCICHHTITHPIAYVTFFTTIPHTTFHITL